MPLLRLIAENIGPFEKLDIDFSDGNGKPHLGPHILAGVNGSGKSTVLRAIAWALDKGKHGFPMEEWRHSLRPVGSKTLVQVSSGGRYIDAMTGDTDPESADELHEWAADLGFADSGLAATHSGLRVGAAGEFKLRGESFALAAYAPSRSLSHVTAPAASPLPNGLTGCLAFESTVQNLAVQRWLVDLFARRALAKEQRQDFEFYERSLNRVQNALKAVFDDPDVRIEPELGPILEPRLHFHGRRLNFSQLPDGVRTTLGWIADFMMRQELATGKSTALLLLDEVDIYLHPRWQRVLLPALRAALPDVQIIASSHSPFVISSCPDAKIHVLTVDNDGIAHAQRPQDAPFGESVTATLRDIFGVESDFDLRTERDLKEWDDLKKAQAAGKLNSVQKNRLIRLGEDLSSRSEELRLIVSSPPKISSSLLHSLQSSNGKRAKKPVVRRRKAKLA